MQELLQRDQITQLIELIRDDGQSDLVKRMFRNLETESQALAASLQSVSQQTVPEQLHQIHSLKNLFGNFGAFKVTRLLDSVYQLLKRPDCNPSSIQQYIHEYNILVPETIASIRTSIGPWISA